MMTYPLVLSITYAIFYFSTIIKCEQITCNKQNCSCQNNNLCEIDCLEANCCHNENTAERDGYTLTCKSGQDCIMQCDTNSACQDSIFDGSSSVDFTLNCNGKETCKRGTVYCGSGNCNVICDNVGGQSCRDIIMNCGSSKSCSIACNPGNHTDICQNIQINLQSTQSFECIGSTATNFCSHSVPAPFTAPPRSQPTFDPTINPTNNPTTYPSANPTNKAILNTVTNANTIFVAVQYKTKSAAFSFDLLLIIVGLLSFILCFCFIFSINWYKRARKSHTELTKLDEMSIRIEDTITTNSKLKEINPTTNVITSKSTTPDNTTIISPKSSNTVNIQPSAPSPIDMDVKIIFEAVGLSQYTPKPHKRSAALSDSFKTAPVPSSYKGFEILNRKQPALNENDIELVSLSSSRTNQSVIINEPL